MISKIRVKRIFLNMELQSSKLMFDEIKTSMHHKKGQEVTKRTS